MIVEIQEVTFQKILEASIRYKLVDISQTGAFT